MSRLLLTEPAELIEAARKQRIRWLELRLELLRNGLAMPLDQEAIAQCEHMLKLAREEWTPWPATNSPLSST